MRFRVLELLTPCLQLTQLSQFTLFRQPQHCPHGIHCGRHKQGHKRMKTYFFYTKTPEKTDRKWAHSHTALTFLNRYQGCSVDLETPAMTKTRCGGISQPEILFLTKCFFFAFNIRVYTHTSSRIKIILYIFSYIYRLLGRQKDITSVRRLGSSVVSDEAAKPQKQHWT